MGSHDSMSERTFRTDDPAEHDRLGYAWFELERTLADGNTAAQLDTDDLDYIIGDLIGIRHRRLPGADRAMVSRRSSGRGTAGWCWRARSKMSSATNSPPRLPGPERQRARNSGGPEIRRGQCLPPIRGSPTKLDQ
jgi:hypothetical protein